MLGLNPMMIMFALKSKLNEIIEGNYPEGFKLKEKTENKIHLTVSEVLADPEIKTNELKFSITFKNIEILLTND